MRKLSFNPPDTEEWKKWLKSCAKAQKKAVEAAANGDHPKISDTYKKQRAVFFDINGPFRGKCAYCEQHIVSDQSGDVEHYRPKSGVQDFDGKVVERTIGLKTEIHPGYYWLAYDWQNLLPSCQLCNVYAPKNGFGKGTRFPIDGPRGWSPGEEANEQPQLLNPRLDDPSEHIALDVSNGLLEPLSPRGRITIELLGLNMRELPHYRLQAYEDARSRYYQALGSGVNDGAAAVAAKLAALRADESRSFISVVRKAYKQTAAEISQAVAA